MGLGMATLGLFGLQKVAPDAVVKIPGGIGEKLAHDAHEDGSRGELINGFLGSVIGLGAFGTVKGIATGGMTPDDQEPTLGGKIGGTIGTVGAFGLLAAAVVGAVQHGKIGFAGTSDAGTKQPGATPGKPGDNSNSLNKTA